jgi:hypothetical protein
LAEPRARKSEIMMGSGKVICPAATLLLVATLAATPAKAQFAGNAGGSGGADMMTQMAPMLEMIKAKMGKRRFAALMQTVGPMMGRMMENGSFNGMMGGGSGGFGGGTSYAPNAYGMGGGGDIMGMLGANGGELMGMIPQLMRLADLGAGGGRHHHHRRH